MKKVDIEVVPYSSEWPVIYEKEAEKIRSALGEQLIALYHIGSTSVPGLAAKPRIDMIAEVKSGDSSIAPLSTVGFEYRGEWNIPFKWGFSKRGEVSANLHVYEQNHPEVELNVAFRNALRQSSELRDAYGALKCSLLKDERSFQKEKGQRFSGYNLGKDSFITRVLKESGFDRLRFLKCTHYKEWQRAKELRLQHFLKLGLTEDPGTWTFDHQDHEHFVLYQGVDIVGYAHVDLSTNIQEAKPLLVMDEKSKKSSDESLFLGWIEQWLTSRKEKQ